MTLKILKIFTSPNQYLLIWDIGLVANSADWLNIVPEITVPLKNNISQTIRSLPHLIELKFAHSAQSTECFEIDLLIGADHYWDNIEDKLIRGKGPTTVQSKVIRYLLSGPINRNIYSSCKGHFTQEHSHWQRKRKIHDKVAMGTWPSRWYTFRHEPIWGKFPRK